MNQVSPLFATYDRASETYGPPFAAPHAGVAIRGFTDAINQPDKSSDISRHPDDFDLYEVGEFDASNGVIRPHPDPSGHKLVVQGKQIALQLSSL